jgi:predicted acyltransferase (DUF342 family)
MSSWKKYGGKDKFDNMSDLTVKTLVCENFIMRNKYQGSWSFTGALDVSKDATIGGNLFVYQNADISGNLNIHGILIVEKTDISGTISVSEDILVRRNIYIGPEPGVKTIISGKENMFGINLQNTNLHATLDISGNMERTIDIHAYTPNNKNVIARNMYNQGITVNVEPSRAYIDFYIDNSMNLTSENRNARILYEPSGVLTVEADRAFRVLPTAIFSDNSGISAFEKEAVVIYNSTDNVAPYLYYHYNDLSYNSGNAANIVASDNSSNVFLTMRTQSGAGLAVGGGYLSGNMIMGTLALTDLSNVKHSAMNIISGNFNKQIRTAIGVNKHSVVKNTDGSNKYAMEVNGPIKINHQEINVVADTPFEILSQCFFDNSGFAIGTLTHPTTNLDKRYLLTTSDGGFSWVKNEFIRDSSGDGLNSGFITLTAGFSSKTYPLYLVAGSNNFGYYSNNYGLNWKQIFIESTNTINTTAIYLSPNNSRLIIGCNVVTGSVGCRILNSTAFNSYPNVVNINTATNDLINIGLTSINAIDGFGSYAFIVGQGGIVKCNITDISNNRSSIASSGTYYGIHFFYDGSRYHSIAVGENSLYYSHDAGSSSSWTQIAISGTTMRSVYIVNSLTAYAVGNNGAIMMSIDGFITWKKFSYNELNYMGNASRLFNTNLKNVWSRGSNDLIITGTITNYSPLPIPTPGTGTNGNSYIFDLFYPYFFNHNNYNAFEVSGNMVMSGDLRINDYGRLMTNNSSFYILPENASQIYIGNTSVGGKTNILNNLDVCGNEIIYGNLEVYRDVSVNRNLYVTGKTIHVGDVSLSGNLQVSKAALFSYDVSMLGNLLLGRDASLNGNLAVLYDVSVNRNLYVSGKTVHVGDVSLSGNLQVSKAALFSYDVSMLGNLLLVKDASLNGNLAVLYDVSVNRNLYVTGKTVHVGDVSLSGNLQVSKAALFSYDVSMLGNLLLSKDASLNGNLAVLYDVSVNRNLYVKGKTVFAGDVSLSGNLQVSKAALFSYDVSMLGNLLLSRDASLNGNLAVLYDVSVNRNLYVKGKTIFAGDVSLSGNLQVSKAALFSYDVSMLGNLLLLRDASLNGNLAVLYDVSVNRNLYVTGKTIHVGDVSLSGNLQVSKAALFSYDVSMLGNLLLVKDASLNGNLAVLYDVSVNRNLYISGKSRFLLDVSMLGNLDIQQNTTSLKMALGKTAIDPGYTLDIYGNVSIKNGYIQQW